MRVCKGFLVTGWNSVFKSICAGVPILAWPMMAEQPLNARMVCGGDKGGLRVETCGHGSVRGFVKWEGLEKMVKELMEGEKGKEVRKKCMEVTEKAKKAMKEARVDHLSAHWTCSLTRPMVRRHHQMYVM